MDIVSGYPGPGQPQRPAFAEQTFRKPRALEIPLCVSVTTEIPALRSIPNGGCARGVGRPILTGGYGNGGQPPYDPDSCRTPAAVRIWLCAARLLGGCMADFATCQLDYRAGVLPELEAWW